MIVTLKDVATDDITRAPDFGEADQHYLTSITHRERRAQAIAARHALAAAFEEWSANPKRPRAGNAGPISSSLHDEVLIPYEPLERELRRLEAPDDEAREARRARRARLRQASAWRLERGQWGAPLLTLRDPLDFSAPTLHTTMAHSPEFAVAGLSPWRIGVDIEDSRRAIIPAWRRLATFDELATFETLADDAARQAFALRSWLVKECWAKMLGDGLVHRAKQVSLQVEDGAYRLVSPLIVTTHIGRYGHHLIASMVEDFGEDPDPPCGSKIFWEERLRG